MVVKTSANWSAHDLGTFPVTQSELAAFLTLILCLLALTWCYRMSSTGLVISPACVLEGFNGGTCLCGAVRGGGGGELMTADEEVKVGVGQHQVMNT